MTPIAAAAPPGQLPLLHETTSRGPLAAPYANGRTQQVRCDACGRWRAPWRCTRGVGRCYADAQATYVAAIVPRVPLRHWTLALPRVGGALARAGPGVWAAVVRAFVAALFTQVRTRARTHWGVGGRVRCGAVTVVRRQSALGPPTLRVHALLLDGAYVGEPGVQGSFWPDSGAPDADAIAANVGARLKRAWQQGTIAVAHVPVRGPPVWPHDNCARLVDVGRRRGVVVGVAGGLAAEARAQVLALTRQLARPAADPCRLRAGAQGRVSYRLPFALSDGTRTVTLSPDDVAQRLGATLGFSARRIRYHGILAAGAGARHQVLPSQLGLGVDSTTLVRPTSYAGRPPHHRHPRARSVP